MKNHEPGSLDILIAELSESTIENREEVLDALTRLRDLEIAEIGELSKISLEMYVRSCRLVDVAISYIMRNYDSNSELVKHAREAYRISFHIHHAIRNSSKN